MTPTVSELAAVHARPGTQQCDCIRLTESSQIKEDTLCLHNGLLSVNILLRHSLARQCPVAHGSAATVGCAHREISRRLILFLLSLFVAAPAAAQTPHPDLFRDPHDSIPAGIRL
jgi:hypothetical protein